MPRAAARARRAARARPTRWRTRSTTSACRTCGCCSRPAPIRTRARSLAHAVRRGRGPEFLRLLAEHGAELDRPGGETWRGDVPAADALPARRAARQGRHRRDARRTRGVHRGGAGRPLGGGRGAGDRPPAPLPDVLDPDAQEVLILAALRGRLDAVVDAVGVGFQRSGRRLARGDASAPRRRGSATRTWCARCSPRGADPLRRLARAAPLGVGGPRLAVLGGAGPRPRRRRGAPRCCRRSGRAALRSSTRTARCTGGSRTGSGRAAEPGWRGRR